MDFGDSLITLDSYASCAPQPKPPAHSRFSLGATQLLSQPLWHEHFSCYYNDMNGIVILFLMLATAFALMHTVAIVASLYWYYWWFDILMHFWGGALIALGVHALATCKRCTFEPDLKILLVALFVITISWEVFERAAGLYDHATYIFDTTKDLLLGFSAGLLTHVVLQIYSIKK